MRVLHIQKVKQIAGSEKYILNLLKSLSKKKIYCEFICVYEDGQQDEVQPYIDLFSQSNIACHAFKISSALSLSLLWKIRRILKRGNFNLVHSHLIHADFWCAMLKKLLFMDFKLLSTKHGYDEAFVSQHGFDVSKMKKDRYYKIAKLSERNIDHSHTVSHALKRLYCELGICDESKIEVIEHGIKTAPINTNAKEYKMYPIQLVVPGRLIPLKGHSYAFKALKLVLQEIPNAHILVVGSGPFEESLRVQAETLELSNHVHFMGFRNDLNSILFHSEICIVPSKAEGFGMVILDSFAADTPVIAFDVPALNEIIESNLNGILVEPFNERELADRIIEMILDPKKAKSLSMKAKSEIEAKYDYGVMIEKIMSLYNNLNS